MTMRIRRLRHATSRPVALAYESTGVETSFTNGLDPEPASRREFSFHRPETLAEILDSLRRQTSHSSGSDHLMAGSLTEPVAGVDTQAVSSFTT
jgi:predicted short-subunit dehydrogenase-like oxidoreductase (DUF2520 family)